MRAFPIVVAAGLLAVGLAACTPSPYVHDPACAAAYENCVRACEMGPPMPAFGMETMPNFEHGCMNACYTDARACEGRARGRKASEAEKE